MSDNIKHYSCNDSKVTFVNGDGVLAIEGMQRFQDYHKFFDMAIVDPPYFDGPNNLGYYGEGYRSKIGVERPEYKKNDNWDVPDQKYFDNLYEISKNQIIWGINYYNIINPGSGRIVWDKCNGNSSFSDCEIAYCSKIQHVKKVTYMWNGMMQGKSIKEGTVQKGNKKLNEKRIHPTQKPVILYKWQLEQFTEKGYNLIDTHGGSGSIAIACWDMGRNIIIYEKDKYTFLKSIERFEKHISQQKLFSI